MYYSCEFQSIQTVKAKPKVYFIQHVYEFKFNLATYQTCDAICKCYSEIRCCLRIT